MLSWTGQIIFQDKTLIHLDSEKHFEVENHL